MTLQQSGQISALDIIVEQSITPADSLSVHSAKSRALAKRSSGQIAYSDFYGKASCVPGSVSFDTPGYYYWTVPPFGSLTVNVWGAGGGGGGYGGYGTAGGYSAFSNVIAYGGGGGGSSQSLVGGAGGYGLNATTTLNGTIGSTYGGYGGNSGNGGAGGAPGVAYLFNFGRAMDNQVHVGQNGANYGGGGGATQIYGGKFRQDCGAGGGGAFASRSYEPYELPVGAIMQVIVGDRGVGGDSQYNNNYGYGGYGAVHIEWNCGNQPPPPQIPRDTVYKSYCTGYNLFYTVADGNGGTYEKFIESNSATCGYVAPADPGSGSGAYINSCFLKGSLVAMADGTFKPIEDVKIGEMLLGAYGVANPVLALNRPLLGDRSMSTINGEHTTTLDHAHLRPDNTFGAVSLYEYVHGENNTIQQVIVDAEGTTEMWLLPGFAESDMDLITQIELGDQLVTVDGSRTVTSLDQVKLPADTQLYNFVMGGDHTYFVSDYCVTGFLNGIDFDYRNWQPVGQSWTRKEYHRP